VRTARDVRAELRERACDLLLLDVSLETDGLELLQALRFSPQAPRGGIVMLADREDVTSQERAQQLGAAAVLSKPLDLAGLSATVRDLLECM
jgi:DNA-binding response OmpR family regulator